MVCSVASHRHGPKRPVALLCRGRRLVDGAVFEAVPFRQAIADGCTHLVVLCTRPPFKCVPMDSALTARAVPENAEYICFNSGHKNLLIQICITPDEYSHIYCMSMPAHIIPLNIFEIPII